MYLKVLPAATRATTDPVAAVPTIAVQAPGWIFFVSSSGTITKKLEITNDVDYDVDDTPGQVSLDDLSNSGVVIQNVPASSSRVYVFCTLPEDLFEGSETNISSCLETMLNVADVASTGSGVDNVPLFGNAPIVAKSSGNADEFEANVEIAPVAGRVELAKLTAVSEILSFKVTGVYVNDYFDEINFVPANGNRVNNQSELDKYVAGESGYTADGILYDELDGASDGTVFELDDSKVFAYNLLPRSSVEENPYFPHLVIKIEDVILADGNGTEYNNGTDPWFITITSVLDANTQQPVEFEAGNVYSIDNLPFERGDLSPVPEPGNKKVEVTVSVKQWVLKTVKPNLN
jgi:hypothetical protein